MSLVQPKDRILALALAVLPYAFLFLSFASCTLSPSAYTPSGRKVLCWTNADLKTRTCTVRGGRIWVEPLPEAP